MIEVPALRLFTKGYIASQTAPPRLCYFFLWPGPDPAIDAMRKKVEITGRTVYPTR
jgi:hypothetical protein